MTFLAYYNNVRIQHALQDLQNSEKTIEQIALDNGFRDSRAFVSSFKKKYDCLPSVYRKQLLENNPGNQLSNTVHMPQEPNENVDLQVLSKYLSWKGQANITPLTSMSEKNRIISAETIDVNSPGVPLFHKYRTFCCVGSAKQFLYREVQDMLRYAQKQIAYTYVKFHGILSDEMMVYTEDAKGNTHYSFVLVDKILDFLQEIHLKPLIQLSFMPVKLASDPHRMLDMDHFNVSPPKDMQKWKDLVRALIVHLVQRYGIEEIRTWLYSVWNEPDTTSSMFGWEDTELFYHFYQETFRTVKAVDSRLSFGTPSMMILPSHHSDWSNKFIQYCQEQNCMPDFLNVHYYDNNFQTSKNMIDQGNMTASIALNTDEFAFSVFINFIKQQVKKWNVPQIPIYMTEWNLTVSHRDLINDTSFKSCYIMKNILDNYDRLDSYGYWCLTDFHEELQLSEKLFHGGLGLFTYNGIPKINYNVFRLLKKMGNEMIGKGNGYFVTRSPYKIVIMLYNYEHYSKFTKSFDILTDVTTENVFTEQHAALFTMRLKNLPASVVTIKEMFINDVSGNSFNAWLKMGAPDYASPEDMEYLRQSSYPGLFLHRKQVIDGMLEIQAELASFEVRMIEITYN